MGKYEEGKFRLTNHKAFYSSYFFAVFMNIRKVKAVLEEVIPTIRPSTAEDKQTNAVIRSVLIKLNKQLKSISVEAIVGGSGKKQTQLKNIKEIDVFVLFNYKKYHNNPNISDILEKKLKIFKSVSRIHGSRDYFQVKKDGYLLEIIPILRVSSAKQAQNITDVSPLHSKWVGRKSKNKLDEIRLTKAFLSALGIYGAESYVRGFSGYACEILTIHYGSFLRLLQAAGKWKIRQIIDPEKIYKHKNALLELNKSKTQSPLILIDPVQSSRNVTAALNEESFENFINTSRKFLTKPSPKFFTQKIVTKNDLIKGKSGKEMLLILQVVPAKNKTDVMGSAILHKFELLKDALIQHKFTVRRNSWLWDGTCALLWYFIDKKVPSPFESRTGPLVSDKTNSARFKKKHKKTFVKNRRLFAKVKRKFLQPKELVKFVLAQDNFKRKIKSVKAEWH